MFEKCPLCGGALAGNICESCGYALPRDEEFVAFYNLDPADYPQESAVREIIPEHISEEIYPNRAELANKPINIKVREEAAIISKPAQKLPSVPMRYNMPSASPNRVRNIQYIQNVQSIQNTQPTQSLSEFLWDSMEIFGENFRKCWTVLPLCYFFPQCILIYFVIAGVRLFSGEKVSIPFGLLTAAAAVLGFLGGFELLM